MPSRNTSVYKTAPDAKVSGYRLRDDQIEQALLTGAHPGLLEDYFGEETYRELRELSQEAATTTRRRGPRVLILPGIMGSKLGKPGAIFDDVLWLDPIDIAMGNLAALALNDAPPTYEPVGVFLLTYLKLKLRLKVTGYDVDFFPFDWRQGIDHLGTQLAQRIDQENAQDIFLVAHSMGGLVARAAMVQNPNKVKRLIMLGTPNYGSFAVPQALRGTHPVVRKVAMLDLYYNADELAAQVFNTFPGLYHMMPAPEKFSLVDLYNPAAWPQDGPQPRPDLLGTVQPVQQSLAHADDRFFLIAGVNQETVTNLRREEKGFVYDVSFDGDGTVPLDFAALPGTKTYFIAESHGSLPNNRMVASAVVDLIEKGKTTALRDQWVPTSRGTIRQVRDHELHLDAFDGRKGRELSHREMRYILEEVAAPVAHETQPGLPTAVAGESARDTEQADSLDRIVIDRRRHHRLDIRLALGSITEADSQAYVLGMFRDVEPSGPASAMDDRLHGAITALTARRMISGRVGEVFMLPSGRHTLLADVVMFAGLGPFDRFSEEVQQLVAENAIRTLIRAKIDDFATVLIGAGSGRGTASSLRNLLIGFLRGLRDTDEAHRFRSITFCEQNSKRHEEMKRELYRLSGTSLFDEVEITFYEIPLPPPLTAAPVRRDTAGPESVYLIVAQQASDESTLALRSSVLTAGAKATVVTGVKAVNRQDLAKHLDQIEPGMLTYRTLSDFGKRLAELVLADEVVAVLSTMREHHLIVAHDAPASRLPWETIHIEDSHADWHPAADAGLSRKYITENLSVAKWLESRHFGTSLDLLLVVNPTEDLRGAEDEGRRIRDLFENHPAVRIERLRGSEAKKGVLLGALRSGTYDVIHYAGHAFFDEQDPPRSGLLCSGREVLSGAELAGVGNLPALVFFNACEAARVRRGATRRKRELGVGKSVEKAVGLAEAFLRGGVANYVGTYWPVGDAAAKCFSEMFYTQLLNGESIGRALQAGRAELRKMEWVDWANYVHYGSYNFVLKRASSEG